jgi:hypothetical protein
MATEKAHRNIEICDRFAPCLDIAVRGLDANHAPGHENSNQFEL